MAPRLSGQTSIFGVVFFVSKSHLGIERQKKPRENKETERGIEGVGWDMSIPLKLFLGFDGNGSLFPQTSA